MQKWRLEMNLEFDIIPGEIKPVIDYNGINILFDTGADTPVWSRGENFLNYIFLML